jgi:uroporphyrinogen decarboxylase
MRDSKIVVDALLRKKPAPRMGLVDFPWGYTVKEWVKQGYPVDEQGNPVDPTEHFQFDIKGCGGWFDWQPKRGVSDIIEETHDWKLVRNGAGAVMRWWKNKAGTPEHVDFTMTSRAVWEKEYRPLLLTLDRERLKEVDETRKRLAKANEVGCWTYYGHQFIWENMRASMGDVTMFMALIEDPEWIHDFCRVYTDFYKTYFRIMIEESGKPDSIWLHEDLGYRDRLFCSPQTLEELIFPYYKEMVDFFHSYDLPVVLHSCGFVEPALDLIVKAGFDGLNPMEVKAGCDIFRIAEKTGDKLAFIGGLDARILESGDRSLIKREIVRLLQGMKERGARYVYGSDHSLSTLVPYRDFQYAVEVYRENMMY